MTLCLLHICYDRRERKLDILFLNAGLMNPSIDLLTVQGHDLSFGVNFLSQFLLFQLLYPLLLAATSTSFPSRVVWLSSSGHYQASQDLSTVHDGPARRAKSTFWMYGHSKLVPITMSYYFMRTKGEKDGVVMNAADPGTIVTGILRYTPTFTRMLLRSPQVRRH